VTKRRSPRRTFLIPRDASKRRTSRCLSRSSSAQSLAIAEQYFSAALREINVADLARQALHVRGRRGDERGQLGLNPITND